MRKEVKIGLTIIAGLLTVYLVVTWVKNLHFFSANRNTYQIRFQDVAGLKTGDPVSVFGYPSGNVVLIRLENSGAIVEINLSPEVDLRRDATAEIRVKELLGGKLIALNPGMSSAKLPPETIINGSTSLDFSSAFSRVGEFLDLFDAEEIDSLVHNINKVASTFARLGDDLDSLDTGGMLRNIESSASSLSGILDDVDRRGIVAKIDRTLGQVDALASKADKSLGAITDLTDQIGDRTLPKADTMLDRITTMLDDAEGMIESLKKLVEQLEDETTVAGKLLYDPQLAEDLEHTVDNLNETLDHIRTKKIYVVMTTSKKQKVFNEKPVKINGEPVK